MRILKKQSFNISSEESVFGRSSSTIEYSLETNVKDGDGQDNLNDFLPLLFSDNNTDADEVLSPFVSKHNKGKTKSTRNSSMMPETSINCLQECSNVRTPLRSGKKSSSKKSKIRSLFSKSGNAKKDKGKQFSHRRMSKSSGEVPQLVQSGDTEDDSEGEIMSTNEFDVTFLERLMSAEKKPEHPPNLLPGDDEAESFSESISILQSQSSSSSNNEIERYCVGPSSLDDEQEKSETSHSSEDQAPDTDDIQTHHANTVNVLNDIVAMEQSTRNSTTLDDNVEDNVEKDIFEGEDYHAVISDLVSKRLKLEERIQKLEVQLSSDSDDSSKEMADKLLNFEGVEDLGASRSFDDEGTVMTVKASNCSHNLVQRDKNSTIISTIAHIVKTGKVPKGDPNGTSEKRRKTMNVSTDRIYDF